MSVVVRVPAKVNLHLSVGPLRPDGYHDLRTVFQALSLYDEVRIAPASELSVAIEGEGAEHLPVDRRNLAWRAAELVAEHAGLEPLADITLSKRIPVAGGLAGGSADAAGVLVACDALWGTGLTRDVLRELAAELGSDVPFALVGGTMLGTGRGEHLSPVLAKGMWHWVLAVAHGGLSTPAVYRELDRLRGADEVRTSDPDELINALRSTDPADLGRLLRNDLEAAAISLRPELRRVLIAGDELGALGGIVSGSGPTCALLARSSDHAVKLAAELAGAGVCRTVRVAHAPVAGARVVGEQ